MESQQAQQRLAAEQRARADMESRREQLEKRNKELQQKVLIRFRSLMLT